MTTWQSGNTIDVGYIFSCTFYVNFPENKINFHVKSENIKRLLNENDSSIENLTQNSSAAVLKQIDEMRSKGDRLFVETTVYIALFPKYEKESHQVSASYGKEFVVHPSSRVDPRLEYLVSTALFKHKSS